MFSIQLANDLHARLIDLAEKTGQPISHHIRQAMNAYLDDCEDVYLAEKRLSEIRSGQSVPRSLDDVAEVLGLGKNRVAEGG